MSPAVRAAVDAALTAFGSAALRATPPGVPGGPPSPPVSFTSALLPASATTAKGSYCGSGLIVTVARIPPPANESDPQPAVIASPAGFAPCGGGVGAVAAAPPVAVLSAAARGELRMANGDLLPPGTSVDVQITQWGQAPNGESAGLASARYTPLSSNRGGEAAAVGPAARRRVAAIDDVTMFGTLWSAKASAVSGVVTQALALAAAAMPIPALDGDYMPGRGLDSRVVSVRVSAGGKPLKGAKGMAVKVPLRTPSIVERNAAGLATGANIGVLTAFPQPVIINITCPVSIAAAIGGITAVYAATTPGVAGMKQGLPARVSFSAASTLAYATSFSSMAETNNALSAVGGLDLNGAAPVAVIGSTVERALGAALVLSAYCGPGGDATLLCAPGTEGVTVTFRCPVVTAVPQCLMWNTTTNGWTAACGAAISGPGLPGAPLSSDAAISCACPPGPDGLADIAVRYAALAQRGQDVFARDSALIALVAAVPSQLLFIIVAALAMALGVMMVTGTMYDADSARRYARALAADAELSLAAKAAAARGATEVADRLNTKIGSSADRTLMRFNPKWVPYQLQMGGKAEMAADAEAEAENDASDAAAMPSPAAEVLVAENFDKPGGDVFVDGGVSDEEEDDEDVGVTGDVRFLTWSHAPGAASLGIAVAAHTRDAGVWLPREGLLRGGGGFSPTLATIAVPRPFSFLLLHSLRLSGNSGLVVIANDTALVAPPVRAPPRSAHAAATAQQRLSPSQTLLVVAPTRFGGAHEAAAASDAAMARALLPRRTSAAARRALVSQLAALRAAPAGCVARMRALGPLAARAACLRTRYLHPWLSPFVFIPQRPRAAAALAGVASVGVLLAVTAYIYANVTGKRAAGIAGTAILEALPLGSLALTALYALVGAALPLAAISAALAYGGRKEHEWRYAALTAELARRAQAERMMAPRSTQSLAFAAGGGAANASLVLANRPNRRQPGKMAASALPIPTAVGDDENPRAVALYSAQSAEGINGSDSVGDEQLGDLQLGDLSRYQLSARGPLQRALKPMVRVYATPLAAAAATLGWAPAPRVVVRHCPWLARACRRHPAQCASWLQRRDPAALAAVRGAMSMSAAAGTRLATGGGSTEGETYGGSSVGSRQEGDEDEDEDEVEQEEEEEEQEEEEDDDEDITAEEPHPLTPEIIKLLDNDALEKGFVETWMRSRFLTALPRLFSGDAWGGGEEVTETPPARRRYKMAQVVAHLSPTAALPPPPHPPQGGIESWCGYNCSLGDTEQQVQAPGIHSRQRRKAVRLALRLHHPPLRLHCALLIHNPPQCLLRFGLRGDARFHLGT